MLLFMRPLGNQFHGIYIFNDFQIVNTKVASAFVDKDDHVHILISTLASIRSYNMSGKLEWIRPGVKYFGDYDQAFIKTNYITATKPISPETTIVFSIDIRNGKIKDSVAFVGKGLCSVPQGLRGNYFILRSRQNSPYDNPLIHIFKLNGNGKILLLPDVKAGFIKKLSNNWKDDLIVLDMWAPMNFENPSRAGIIDTHVGAAMVSTSTGLIVNRFMIPFEGFAYSYIIHSPAKENSLILSYRGNYRNEEQYSGFYEISMPTMEEIKHLEIKGNITPISILLDGRIIAGIDKKKKIIYLINSKTFEIMCELNFSKYLIQLSSRWSHLNKLRGIVLGGSMDINKDGHDDLILLYRQMYGSMDPVWSEIHDSRGNIVGNIYLFVVPGPEYKRIYPLILPSGEEFPVNKLIPTKNLIISIYPHKGKLKIYKLF